MAGRIIFRDAMPEDVGALLTVQHAAPGAAFWQASDYVRALDDPDSFCLLAKDSKPGRVAGFLLARTVADEVEILNLAVRRDYQRQGIGRSLLHTALARGVNRGARKCWLEVRSANQVARAFYSIHGFRENGRRPRYYRDPEDDAVVYVLPLGVASAPP